MARGKTIAGLFVGVVLLAPPVWADIQSYSNRTDWLTALGTEPLTIHFDEFNPGTIVTSQYVDLGVLFVDGNDRIESGVQFVNDGVGLSGNGQFDLSFVVPMSAMAVDFPGAIVMDVYRDGGLVGSSLEFGGGGVGRFGGIITDQPFDRIVLRDWFDDIGYLDSMYLVPEPAGLLLCLIAGMMGTRRRSIRGNGS